MKDILLTTHNGILIGVDPGHKSPNDFMVKYKLPNTRTRTPKHIHLVIDILLKRQGAPELTNKLVEYLLDVLRQLKPIQRYPPSFQVFTAGTIKEFNSLNQYGEYEVEFLLAIFELIMIQEVTNYAAMKKCRMLFEKVLKGDSILSLVSLVRRPYTRLYA